MGLNTVFITYALPFILTGNILKGLRPKGWRVHNPLAACWSKGFWLRPEQVGVHVDAFPQLPCLLDSQTFSSVNEV